MRGKLAQWITLAIVASHGMLHSAAGDEPLSGPDLNGEFRGRIAYSADGNNRDRDDLFASAVTIAMFTAFGVTDKVVHFDYNSILGEDNPEYLKVHEESVRGAAERFGLPAGVIFNDSQQLEAAIRSIRDAVNASSAGDPLYFVIAGPMEVAWRGINAADPVRRKHVYCISHTVWNDVFFWDAGNQELTHHRRESWASSSHTGTWQSRTIENAPVKVGDEIVVKVQAEGGHTGGLDYVQLNSRPH